jgi:hypothetical protein
MEREGYVDLDFVTTRGMTTLDSFWRNTMLLKKIIIIIIIF